MKTAILHYTAPPVVGGVEMVIHEHAYIFLKHNQDVTVFAGRGEEAALPSGSKFRLIPEMDSQNERIEFLSKQLEQGEVPHNFEQMLLEIFNILSPVIEEFDHVIVHNIFTKHFNLPLTAALFRMLDEQIIKHCIAWCHDFTWTSPRSSSKVHPGYPWDLLRTYRSDMSFVTVSKQRQQTLAGLLEIPDELVHVVYNGVNPDQLLGLSSEGSALIDRLELLESDLIILMPVRVTRAKNIELALQTAAMLKDNDIRIKLVITGPPDPHDSESMAYFQSLRDLRQNLSIKNEVHFVFESGPEIDTPYFIDNQIVGDLFRVADLMLMPSHQEGFGMPVLEAGLVGIPVVSTDVPAAEEIGKRDFLSFDSEDSPKEVATLIMNWIEVSFRYRLRRRVRQQYTWESIYRQRIQPLLNLRP